MKRGVLAAIGMLAVVGCQSAERPAFPFVAGSVWTVTAMDGAPLIGDPVLLSFSNPHTFSNPPTLVTIASECGSTSGRVRSEPRGDAIAFDGFGPPRGRMICNGDRMAQFQVVSSALESVDAWQPAGDAFELRGAAVLRLELRDIQE